MEIEKMNAETKHTPGPWFAELDDSDPFGAVEIYAQSGDRNDYLFTISNPYDDPGLAMAYMPTHKAIAALIAAAPDLFEALANLRAHISFDARTDSQEKMDAMRAADAALSKAGG